MTYGMTLDPVRAADQYEEALSQAAADCREHEAKVKAARETLAEIYGKALKGPADFCVPTPGCSEKTNHAFWLFKELDDDLLAELFGFVRDAAAGQDVQIRAKLLQQSVVNRSAEWLADSMVMGKKEAL